MEAWIQQALNSEQAGYTVLAAVFLLGLVSVFTCACNYSIIAVVAGYSGSLGAGGKSKTIVRDAIFFLFGMLVSMAILGAVIGYASELMSASSGKYWKIAAGLIAVFFGLFSMDLLPFKMPGFSAARIAEKQGRKSSVLFGLILGGLALASGTCCNPIFPVIVAASFVKSSMVWGILMLLVYALGYGVAFTAIIIGIGLGAGKISRMFAKSGKVLTYIGGILMIAVGFYLLLTI